MVPKYLYFVFLITYLISTVFGILAISNIISSLYGTGIGMFAELVLAYIIYLALGELLKHREELVKIASELVEELLRQL